MSVFIYAGIDGTTTAKLRQFSLVRVSLGLVRVGLGLVRTSLGLVGVRLGLGLVLGLKLSHFLYM